MKIAVVGGGFAGLLFAYKLVTRGYNVELYEEHGRVGFPKHCTGLVSSRTVELIGKPARDNIISRYRGVTLRTGDSRCTIDTIDEIVKLDRVKLEEDLKREAETYGARILLKSKVEALRAEGILSLGGEVKRYDLVILAEGVHGGLRRSLSIKWKPLVTYGYNIEVEDRNLEDASHITIEFKENLAGFTWRIPLPRGTLYGVLSRTPRQSREILSGMAPRGLKTSASSIYGGVVVHGPPLEKARIGKVLVVGDAAGFNKPLTGGGLYPNSLLADILASMDLASNNYDIIDHAVSRVSSLLSRQFRIARAYYSSPSRGYRVLDVALSSGLCDILNGRITYDGHESLISIPLSKPARLLGLLTSMFVKGRTIDLTVLLAYYLGLKEARV